MPVAIPASVLPQLLALEDVIRYIFDREACLLPGYFVINEINRVYSENRGWPHWVRTWFFFCGNCIHLLHKL